MLVFVQMVEMRWRWRWWLLPLLTLCWVSACARAHASCNRTRQVLTGTWGVISDGPDVYPEASHCQWLIRASSPGQYITLNVTSIETECSYDHLYVYDGEMYNSPVLGVFSGKTVPPQVTASSGAMLILLYSDTNYALDGFVAEFSVTDCPLNCSDRGVCDNHRCNCIELYSGEGCEHAHCPENCGFAQNRGHCHKQAPTPRDPRPAPYCLCNEGYYGDGCSLGTVDVEGSTWHWLWRGGTPFDGRTSHASVYVPHLDSLYVYGGYNLNQVLGDLLIFDFGTSVWVNVSDPASQSHLSRRRTSQRTMRLKDIGMTAPLTKNLTFTVNSNKTVSVKYKSLTGEGPQLERTIRSTENIQHFSWLKDAAVHQESDNSFLRNLSHPLGSSDLHSSKFKDFSGNGVRTRRMIRPSEELNHTPTSQIKNPGPRYGHVMEEYGQHFVLFGGKLASEKVSNELWLYNTTLSEWHLIEGKKRNSEDNEDTPPALMYATLTRVDSSWLYLFGGSLEHGEFSNRMYRINLEGDKVWERVLVRGGNELQVRVVGHSTVFHAPSRSLLIYGGIRVDTARFSKLSDHLLVFDVDQHYWSQINYPKPHNNRLQHVPLERAFHSAIIAGNYMVIFGGYMHKHKEEETCYDSNIYLYHLGCHIWMSHQFTPTGQFGVYPKIQGVYGHSAFLRGGNTMVVVGGFHGTVNSHVLAYVLPSTLVSPSGRDFDMDEACRRHSTQALCVLNLECGWCPSDTTCYERSRGANCTNNLQTTHCPGICSSLHSCQACAVHGRFARGRSCAWCVQTARCHERDEPSGALGRCGSADDNPLGQEGWWGPHGNDLITPKQCQEQDLRPGITVIRYRHPVDLKRPDHVAIVNETLQDLRDSQEFRRARELHTGGSTMAQFIGFIHPLGVQPFKGDNNLMMFIKAPHTNASLWVSRDDTEENLELVASIEAKAEINEETRQSNKDDIFPDLTRGHRYLTKLQVSQPVQPSSQQASVMSIMWNAQSHASRMLSLEYLEPYSVGGEACTAHTNCLACLTDAKCGWCDPTSSCVARQDHSSSCSLTNSEGSKNNYFLTLVPEQCVRCEQYIYCSDCVGSMLCEWLPDEAYCSRKGRFPSAVTEVTNCPAPCHKRKTCATCLGDPGRCAWCQQTSECFLFSVYTSVYQYGLCQVWLDEDHTNMSSTLRPTSSTLAENTSHIATTLPQLTASTSVEVSTTKVALDASECHICENLQSCEACLESMSCGWCYNVFNPTIGICTSGDFSQPDKGECVDLIKPILLAARENASVVMDHQLPETEWAYASCPDVDECKLSLHDCHRNATCSNMHPGFNCTCNRGFSGNGHTTCDRTCFESCEHGLCSGRPDYKCLCNLGWTGPDCATNCDCHNHSTCHKGIGICDQCQDWTAGKFCEICQPGSFGDATTVGCKMCECNDHWDETLGQCNQTNGECFCIDNTHGHNCHKCLPGFYGDPRNGGRCFRECSARNILYEATTGYLGAQTTGLDLPAACMWIITPSDSSNGLKPLPTSPSGLNVIQITIEEINIDCSEGVLYIYDGLPDFVSGDERWDRKNHIIGTFCESQASYPVTVQAVSGLMTVFYEKNKVEQGFNASYKVLECVDNVGHHRVCVNNKTVCDERWSGVHCDIPVCPNKCSESEGIGRCHTRYGRCICVPGFVGDDCSIVKRDHQVVVTQLFAPEKMASQESYLKTVLPRMGHSLIVDHRGSLWIFGGYSLSRGPLNDIQHFDTRNISNIRQQVTVNVQPGHQPPPARYFHAAAYVPSQREMYVYGGLNETTFLKDFWKFNIESESWKILQVHPDLPPLAGHSLTYRSDTESQSLLLIGGASSDYGFLERVWEYNLASGEWDKVETGGAIPVGIYGHSTVYHEGTKTFYVYGGYSFKVDKVDHFPDLYALDYVRKQWSVLPLDQKTNLNPASRPAPRTFHSAVTTQDYMVIVGGDITDHLNSNQGLIVYSYKCNMWIPLNDKFITLVGHEVTPHIGTTAGIYGSTIYVFGGYYGTLHGSLVEIRIPPDLCTLNVNQTQCRDVIGCANCVVYESSGTNTSYCYSNTREEPGVCRTPREGKTSVVGVRCDAQLLDEHDCYQHMSCSECLAEWPAHPQSEQRCQWCRNCSKGKCIPRDSDCAQECNSQARDDSSSGRYVITELDNCHVDTCVASDCNKCGNLRKCIWTRQVFRSSELGYKVQSSPLNEWNCINGKIHNHSFHLVESYPPSECPKLCHLHTNCHDCLSSKGAEGGWQQCHWSPFLKECLSPSYIALRCLGGTCGLLLTGNENQCPQPCKSYSQCSQCLSHPKCGWCALNTQVGGLGLCTEGRLEGPYRGKCDLDFSKIMANSTITSVHRLRHTARLYPNPTRDTSTVTWHYDVCPPENECKNNHHTCDAKSQSCMDQEKGYECVCAPGYNMTESGQCMPVCSQGCVSGSCVEPDKCTCNFGYVGTNCSTKCLCNGHANCVGPDKLDKCIACFNNTVGNQCEKCKYNYVGDPQNNGQCVSCFDYCNTHANSCIPQEELTQWNVSFSQNTLMEKGSMLRLQEGARADAVCLKCANNTTGSKCDSCLPGYFRGSENLRDPCRPCQCNGHGTTCNAVWGTDCNCGNNTDTQCTGGTKGRGGSNEKEDGKPCSEQQCAKCKDTYLGNPSNGHQCYRQMNVEKVYCLDPSIQNDCNTKTRALNPGQTVFFAVQPKFMNVDIRLILDVTTGGADVYFSSKEDTFVVTVNQTTGQQQVDLDSNFIIVESLAHIVFNTPIIKRRTYLGTGFDHVDRTGLPILPTKELVANTTQLPLIEYHLIENVADGLKTFATVSRSNDILVVRNVTNRLVITLPQNQHDLRSAKFYVVVYGIGSEKETDTFGSIYFRQDQPRIDLFVFFSVFFSCFFLFLAVCVVVWKIKQGVDMRRARRRHVVEMLHMAKRPCAVSKLVLHTDDDYNPDALEVPLDPTPWSPNRRKRATKKDRYADGFDVGPLAVEPSDDGVAAVVTVMVQLPGGGIGSSVGPGEGPTHRLALGSALCLMSRIYPPAPRPFHLRRRTSHMTA